METVIPKIGQEVLAARVGTTRSRINFFMNKFRKLGFIEYNGGGLKVHSSLLNIVVHDWRESRSKARRCLPSPCRLQLCRIEHQWKCTSLRKRVTRATRVTTPTGSPTVWSHPSSALAPPARSPWSGRRGFFLAANFAARHEPRERLALRHLPSPHHQLMVDAQPSFVAAPAATRSMWPGCSSGRFSRPDGRTNDARRHGRTR
jgi:hypothetical protein